MMRSTLIFLLFLAASFATAAIGGIATGPGVRDWYPSLNKPPWNPPAWIFGPVWTFLYLCIAVAGFLVWRKAGFSGAKGTLLLFTLQLILNAGWSWVFFGMRQPGWAFAEIIVLWIVILATTIALFRVSQPAGGLFIPYLAWVTFASVLNGTIWQLNL
jgi:tryptophan-rich sensory protein